MIVRGAEEHVETFQRLLVGLEYTNQDPLIAAIGYARSVHDPHGSAADLVAYWALLDLLRPVCHAAYQESRHERR